MPSGQLTRASVVISANTIFALGLVIALGIGLSALLRFTRLGVWLRATSERAPTAELLGVPVRRLSVGLWSLSGALAALAIILLAPTQTGDVGSLGAVSIQPFAAALVASFSSFGVTIAAALAIGMVESAIGASSAGAYSFLISFAPIVVVLLWFQRREVWNE